MFLWGTFGYESCDCFRLYLKYVEAPAGFRVELVNLKLHHVLQYPEGIGKYDYIPNFAARGLHYDIEKVSSSTTQQPPVVSLPFTDFPLSSLSLKTSSFCIQGLLMKIDAFHYIQPGTVYR